MYESTTGREYGTYSEPRPIYTPPSGGLGGVVTIANLLMAAIMAIALVRAQMSAIAVVITTGLYYASTTSLFLLITSGALTEIVRTHSDARTQRELHRLQLTLYSPPAPSLPEPPDEKPALAPPGLPQTPSFVPPATVDDGARRAAGMWLLNLYGPDGQLDPKKVLLATTKERPGRIRIKTPAQPAIDYLVQRRILRPLEKDGQPNGYALNMRYALLAEAAQAL